MASPLTSQNFADVIDPVFRDIAQEAYDKGKSRISDLFNVKTSDRATEKFSEVTPMGKFSEFSGAIDYDGIEQGYDVTATHIEFAKGVQIQRKLYDDDQHNVIDDQASALGEAAFKTHEDDAATIFTGSFSTPTRLFSHSEGVALCSNSHTTPVSNVSTTTGFDNLATAELSPVALTAAVIQFRQFKDPAGDLIDMSPDMLIVPVNLVDRATEIVKTTKGLDSAEGTINVHDGRFQVYDWYRLSDTNDYWLVNKELMKKNLLWFWRVKLEIARMESFDNIVAKTRGYLRYSMLRRSWRFVLGSQVT